MTAWPDDIQISERRASMEAVLQLGYAVCPRCLHTHKAAGKEHQKRPWSITPCCRDCGEVLLMPYRRGVA